MRTCRSFLVFLLLPTAALAQQAGPQAQFAEARLAWEAGRYVEALGALERLLTGPAASQLLEPAALLTGELYRVTELAPDGRAVRWSPDGRHVAFETGAGSEARTRILAVEGASVRPLAEVPGSGLVFSPSGQEVAYLTVGDTAALRRALAALPGQAAPGDRAAMTRARAERARIEAQYTRIVVRDLAQGRERQLAPGGLGITGLLYGPADGALWVVGFPGEDPANAGLYRLDAEGRPSALPGSPRPRVNPRFAARGTLLVFGAGADSIGITEVATGRTRVLAGTSPTLSADGGTLAFVGGAAGAGTVSTLALGPGDAWQAEPSLAARSTAPLAANTEQACPSCPALSGVALSPDGSRVVYQAMPREDWDIFVADGKRGEGANLTREIQHDLFPVFLADGRLLSMKGEGRHRRAHLYDLASGTATWLFRNNTVRTVAPEYEWAPSPDGTRILVVAERDGDTVSPERGVYLLDLGSKVTLDDVRARIRAQLTAEQDLRQRGERMYGPVSQEIRAVVDRISTARIWGYERDLFRFGSKHITQPGNAMAIEYLAAKLREFGYEPELQWFEPRGSRTANVVVRLEGTTDPELVYVVSAHFDSNTRSPGADDNTSATVGLLEMARVLAGHPLPATLEIAFFTGEEAGLLGSREYVRRAVDAKKRLMGALNNDMVGWADDYRMDNTIRYSNAGIRDLQHAAAFLFSGLVTYDAKYYKSTDAAAYYDAYGDIVGGIGSYPILASPHYHQVSDVLETVNHQLIAEVAKVTAASAMLLASSPARLEGLEVRGSGSGVEVSWTPAPERDVTSYRVTWGPPGEEGAHALTVTEPRARLEGVPPGSVVAVKALNARGLEGWDWARRTYEPPPPSRRP
ncbi:MAG: M28 family peptidase [Gemmatimonadetes bacterium]|nr:M28 family peptidase [Gemmatimonadota bacterium]